jgi:adenine-specific DNA-methyltransferase
MIYSKSDKPVWSQPFMEWDEEHAKKEYPRVEEKTGRRFKPVPLYAHGLRNGETGKPWRGLMPPKGKHWFTSPENLEKLEQEGKIYWSPSGNPRKKVYLDESSGVPYTDIWMNFRDAHNQNVSITGYPTEKNLDMLKMIIKASSDKDDLVLDCFCGSGTTLEAAHSLGRSWIGIDASELAIGISADRIKKLLDYGSTPLFGYDKPGFTVFSSKVKP